MQTPLLPMKNPKLNPVKTYLLYGGQRENLRKLAQLILDHLRWILFNSLCARQQHTCSVTPGQSRRLQISGGRREEGGGGGG
jgi:hypothetical protein